MSPLFKLKTFSLLTGVGLSALFISGCGGGGGGGGTPSGTPSPLDGTYAAQSTPTDALPSDGKAPTSSLMVTNGRGKAQFIYYLQPSVVTAVQAALDQGLRDRGYAGSIPFNQVPSSITFNATGQVDGSGKLVLTQTITSRETVSLCGSATLTLDPTFAANGTAISGQGNYNVQFADRFTLRIRGTDVRGETKDGSCNLLPLRTGTIIFTK